MGGKVDLEGGALSEGAGHPDLTGVSLDQLAGDGQPQPAASARLAQSGRVGAVKTVEDEWQVRGRNSGTAVLHFQAHQPRQRMCAQADLASRGCVAEGVCDQIGEDLVEAVGIAQQVQGGIWIDLAGQFDSHDRGLA